MFGKNNVSEEKDAALMTELVALIKKKCSISTVKNAGMDIILDNNAFTPEGLQNARAVELLKLAGATIKEVATEGLENISYCTSTVCTLTRNQCLTAVAYFKELKDPAADFKPQVICRC